MHKSRINKISLAVCLAFMPIYGLAAGLGKLSVDSGLGEPLKAQIDLISVTPDELSTLSASIASEEAYVMQGIPRLGVHSSIRVEIAKKADGSPVLKLHSQQPIDDPYLDMLIQVDWASGRLLREYTILLDPPGYKQAINDTPLSKSVFNPAYVPGEDDRRISSAGDGANTEEYEVQPRTEVKPRTVDKAKRKQKPTAAEPATEAQQETTFAFNQTEEMVTKRGDTLHSIAKDLQLEGVSIDQMLVGLFNANKNAFVDDNMNRLKVGQIIKIPSKEELTALTSQQAAKEVKVHSANWNAYRNNLAANVLAADAAEGADSRQSASGKIVSAQDQAAPVKSGPQDVVKLSAGGTVAAQGAGKASAESDAKILAMQEEATAREKALKESQERTAALEAQLTDMQKLLALKSQTLADAQKNAAQSNQLSQNQQTAPVELAAAQTEAAKTQPDVAAAKPAEAATPQDKATPVADAKQVPASAEKKPAVAKVPVQPEPVEEPSFFETLLESVNLFMLAGAGGLTLLGAGWLYMRNKRRRDLDSFERGILTSGGLRANTVFGNTTGNATSSADTSFLTDFAQSADGGMIDTTDVDPIAEAEVYMAYGRDAQAEEILKEAISKEPNRYELHLKLLEMYAARKDASAFETIAGELYTILGADDPVWAQVAALGVTVEPDNPLYDTGRIPAATAATTASSKREAKAVETDISKDLDFSFDRPESNAVDEPAVADAQVAMVQEQPQSVEFEQNSFDTGANNQSDMDSVPVFSTPEASATASEKNTTLENKPAADNSMDFDFPDIGSFNVDAGDQTNPSEPASTASSIAEVAETAPVFEMPASEAVEEIQFTVPETAEAEESSALSSLDFNFTTEPVEEESKSEASAESSDLSFEGFANTSQAPAHENTESSAMNAMDFNFEELSAPAAETNDVKQPPALEGISLDFDAEDASAAQADTKVEEISFDFPLTDESAADALDMEADVAAETPNQAANFDLSTISLDLSDEQSQATAEAEVAEPVAAVAVEVENPDVDIKLDLVKVYIDMEDIEGARDLLDEVLKEGGPQQRQKAEQLRASLA